MVGGLARSVVFSRKGLFFYCVYWFVVSDSRGAKRCVAMQESSVLSYLMYFLRLLYTYCFTDSVVCGYERVSREF